MVGPSHGHWADKIRAVVRGEQEYSALQELGVKISRYDEVWEIDNPRAIFLEAAMEDVAYGLVQFEDNPVKLQLWAGFLLSGSSVIGLESLCEGTEGEEILGALWDAAFEGHFSEQTLSLARRIASASPRDGL